MGNETSYGSGTGTGREAGAYTADGGFVPWKQCAVTKNAGSSTVLVSVSAPENSRLVIPRGISFIGESACRRSRISSVVFPPGLLRIGRYAFEWSAVRTAFFPETPECIADRAFAGSSVVSAVFPPSVSSAGPKAFAECADLVSVKFCGCTAVSLGEAVFGCCASLVSAVLPNAAGALIHPENGDGYISGGGSLFLGCTSPAAVSFAPGAPAVPACAFFGCTSLRRLTVPESVTAAGSYAFRGCASLGDIRISSAFAHTGIGLFDGCPYGETYAARFGKEP